MISSTSLVDHNEQPSAISNEFDSSRLVNMSEQTLNTSINNKVSDDNISYIKNINSLSKIKDIINIENKMNNATFENCMSFKNSISLTFKEKP